jgi:hypothetical protein
MNTETKCDICRKTGGVENFGFATDIEIQNNYKYIVKYVNYDICGDCMKMLHRDYVYELEMVNKDVLINFNKLFVKLIRLNTVKNKEK